MLNMASSKKVHIFHNSVNSKIERDIYIEREREGERERESERER